MTTQMIKCNCKHEFQDAMYGVGQRVANIMRTGQVKCTVCGTIGGLKGQIFKTSAATEPEPVATKSDKKTGKESKDKDKGKGKREKIPKPKIDRSKKMGKK